MRHSTRQERARFRYPGGDDVAFVELVNEDMDGETLYKTLEQVPGVEEIYWQTSKHDQGNPGTRAPGVPYDGTGHFLERNVMVKSKLFKQPFEFELTRSMHTKERGTVSMAFKTAPQGQLLEAWRILRHASRERTLFMDKVEEWHSSVRAQYGESSKGVWKETPGAGPATPGASSATLGAGPATSSMERMDEIIQQTRRMIWWVVCRLSSQGSRLCHCLPHVRSRLCHCPPCVFEY